MPSPTTGVLEVLAWPYRRSTNPYTRDLYDTMRDVCPGRVKVEDLRFADAWRARVDVVHVHWPEAAVEATSTVRATLKTVALLGTLHLLRRRGAVLVWTAHNLRSHGNHHPWLEAALRRWFFPRVDGIIHLSPGSVADVVREIPSLEDTPAVVVRHGINRADTRSGASKRTARDALGINHCEVVWLSLGTIRPYKQVPSLIRAFVAARLPTARLVVAGRPITPEIAATIEVAASGAPSVTLALDWMSTACFETYVAAADVVVAAYQELHNSGVVISALARRRPVLCRRSSATEDLQELVGPEWVALVDGPLTPQLLLDHEQWASEARDRPPPLDRLQPATIARATLRAYEQFLTTRPTAHVR
jgi:glycosyltransferase involved in cell wall biosynthesis